MECVSSALSGTAFLLGDPQDVLITAGHVADNLDVARTVVAFATDDGWVTWGLRNRIRHHSEDLAALVLEPGHERTSPLFIGSSDVRASARYRVWGYPVDVMHEVVRNDVALARPDLVYSEGHVRRRISNIGLGHLQGTAFYELSAVAGRGCSGAPVTVDRAGVSPWEVIGVYLGDRRNETEGLAVGYASRAEHLQDLLSSLTAAPG